MQTRKRRSARALLFSPRGEVLLIRFVIQRSTGEATFWAAPGGEIEPGETELEAVTRELMEELGLRVELAGPVHRLENAFEYQFHWIENTDTFFAGRCERDEPRLLGVTAEEKTTMRELRWWDLDALVASGETFYPEPLLAWARDLRDPVKL